MTAAARATAARLPSLPGVYRFRDLQGRALYVGRAVDLRRRVRSYWSDLGDRPHLRRMMPRVARVEAVVCASEHEAAWLERNVLERRLLPWNRTAGGQETPVHLRLCASAAEPGLRVVHDATPRAQTVHFGPYLGGTRVRLAAAGLLRVFPLAYTGTRLTPAEQDMARARGVGPERRDELVTALTSVLSREPDAIDGFRAALIARRDAASAELAFERAARLHAELDAVDWVVAPQEATAAGSADGGADLDFCGWASGILVRFEIRGGRLCGWQARSCTELRARAQVAATPPQWTPFAQRNAELAAALLGD